ncbi:hypothetical protein Tco_0321917 [Tanacetum coccineum]
MVLSFVATFQLTINLSFLHPLQVFVGTNSLISIVVTTVIPPFFGTHVLALTQGLSDIGLGTTLRLDDICARQIGLGSDRKRSLGIGGVVSVERFGQDEGRDTFCEQGLIERRWLSGWCGEVVNFMDVPPSPNHEPDFPADDPSSFDESDVESEEDPQEEPEEVPEEDPQEESEEEPEEDPQEDPEEEQEEEEEEPEEAQQMD